MVQTKSNQEMWLSLKYAFIVNKIKNESWYYQNTTISFRQKRKLEKEVNTKI